MLTKLDASIYLSAFIIPTLLAILEAVIGLSPDITLIDIFCSLKNSSVLMDLIIVIIH